MLVDACVPKPEKLYRMTEIPGQVQGNRHLFDIKMLGHHLQ